MLYTSYFANINQLPSDVAIVAITRIPPKNYKGILYQKVAPTRDLLDRWKKEQDEDFYINYYNKKVLSRLSPLEVIQDLKALTNNAENIALVCYEKPNDFCHRHLLSDWLVNAGFPCEEFKKDIIF